MKKDEKATQSLDRLAERTAELNGRLGGLSIFLNKIDTDKKYVGQEKDRLINRINQLELDLRHQLEISNEFSAQNQEYSNKMIQFEELLGQIESDKNEMFDKISYLENENEGLVNEKHALKVELAQLKASKADLDGQHKAVLEQLNILESLNNYKQDELNEKKEASKIIEDLKKQIDQLQGLITSMREKDENTTKKCQSLEQLNIQLLADLKKESDYVNDLKREIKEMRAKYLEGIEEKKLALNISNLMASKMYNYYGKNRESVVQGGGINNASAIQKSAFMIETKDMKPLNPNAVPDKPFGGANRQFAESIRPNARNSARPSLRESTMMSNFTLTFS